MTVGEFRTCGALPVSNKIPCFATLLFGKQGSNREFIQNYSMEEIVTEFTPIEVEQQFPVERQVNWYWSDVGKPVIFAFCDIGGNILIGERGYLSSVLNKRYSRFDDYPFVRHQVAKFIGDNNLIRDAKSAVERKIDLVKREKHSYGLSGALRSIYSIPVTSINATFYRLVRATNYVNGLEKMGFTKDQIEEIISLLGRTGYSLPKRHSIDEREDALEAALRAPFEHASPGGGRFNDARFGALYATRVLKDAYKEVSYWAVKMLHNSLNAPSTYESEYIAIEMDVSCTLHDIRKYTDLAIAGRSATQRLGKMLRLAGSSGIIYNGGRGHEAPEDHLCLFTPEAVQKCRLLERRQLTIIIDGGHANWGEAYPM